MAQEKEIKIELHIPFDDFIKRINNIGYKKFHEIDQMDIYFDTKDWYLYENIAALRLRQVNGADESFSFKKVFYTPNRKDKYFVEELEVKAPFNNHDKMKAIFTKLELPYPAVGFSTYQELADYLKKFGYFDEQKMAKRRTIYKSGTNEIVIDDVDKVGIIIELECEHDEPLEVVETILSPTEWNRSVEGTSYKWLTNVFGLKSHVTNFKKFAEIPDWNVWKNEQQMYQDICG